MSGNLIKSDASWKRFQERTNGGAVARRATMESRPSVAKKRREQHANKPSGRPEPPLSFYQEN